MITYFVLVLIYSKGAPAAMPETYTSQLDCVIQGEMYKPHIPPSRPVLLRNNIVIDYRCVAFKK